MAEGRLPPLTFNAWLRWDVIRRALPGLRSGSLLEVGCGRGALAARLAASADYVGCEPDPASFDVAARRVGDRGRVFNDVLPPAELRDFDAVCAFEVLEHIEDDAAALRAWADRLRPGGLLLLSVPAGPHRFGAADRAVGHFRRYDHDGLRRLLLDAGLEAPELRSYGFPLGYALEAGRNALMGRRADGSADVRERTATSGRLLQPPEALGAATRLATWPFRLLQRPFETTRLGTGLVAWARTPR